MLISIFLSLIKTNHSSYNFNKETLGTQYGKPPKKNSQFEFVLHFLQLPSHNQTHLNFKIENYINKNYVVGSRILKT